MLNRRWILHWSGQAFGALLLLPCLAIGAARGWGCPQEQLPTSRAETPFEDALRDSGVPEAAGTVVEVQAGNQVMVDLGIEQGMQVGYLLHARRDTQQLGSLEVVEVGAERSRCLADQPLQLHDRVQLGLTIQMHGRCTDSRGTSLAEVNVGVFRLSGNYVDAPKLVAHTVSDGQGNYRLPKLTAIALGSYGSDLVLVAQKAGWVSQVTPLRSLDEEQNLELSSETGTLVGVVLDPSGRPLAGARVSLPGRFAYIPGIQTAMTDAKGKFLIDDLAVWDPPRGQQRTLWIRHPDFATTMTMFGKVPSVVNLKMDSPAVVLGRVVDEETDKPLPNTLVSAQGVNGHGWYQTYSDREGHYELRMQPDRYNILAESHARMPIAIDSLEAVAGQTREDAVIRMVAGGIVAGTYLSADGQPLADGRVRVAHYGPARPRSGAAVTSTLVAADGSFRLPVAPGENLIYAMNGGGSARIAVENGEQVELELLAGRRAPQQAVRRPAPAAAAMDDFVPSRKRRATAAGALLDRLEMQNQGGARFKEEWLGTLKELSDLGAVALPELCEELDQTTDDMMLRCLGFVLRSIGDARACPALIRAIPKTLRKAGSDMGLRVENAELAQFAQRHDLAEKNARGSYSFGRPVREILTALQELSGHRLSDQELFSISLQGTAQQRAMRQKLFEYHAVKWAQWWDTHATELGVPEEYRQVHLPDYEQVVSVPAVELEALHSSTGSNANWILESALDHDAERVFLDLDTGRVAGVPKRWQAALPAADEQAKEPPLAPIEEIEAWAAEEGFDLMGTQVTTADGKQRVYALRMLGMQAWQIDDARWKTHPANISLQEFIDEGRPVDTHLFIHDGEKLDYEKHGSFFVITREGTPALVFLGIQVVNDRLQPGGVAVGDHELRPIAFSKGRRFAFSFFERDASE